MPAQIIDDEVWERRIPLAVKYKQQWDNLFKCQILNDYYEGRQWVDQGQQDYQPYVINKIYETIQIKIANFVPTNVNFLVHTRAAFEEDLQAAAGSAQLKEDLLNTLTQEPDNNFAEELEQAFKDSFFRFGVLEVGYDADWVMNPKVPKPALVRDADPFQSGKEGRRLKFQPPEIPQNERVYFKHIPASNFIVGGTDHKYLNRCGWYGYYEWVDREDLLSNKKLLNRDKLDLVGGTTPDNESETNIEGLQFRDSERRGDQLKVWHLWDNKFGLELLVVDSPKVTIFQRKFSYPRIFDLRPDKRLITNGFYPIPPAFHWLSPQDEYNETREMLRAHRRRFIRKFEVVEGQMDDEEIEKFENGPDGGLIKVKQPGAIRAIENANLGPELGEIVQIAADDLNRISGTSDESRGIADRTTATQANIVNQRTGVREGKERDRVIKWVSQIGRCVLLTVREKFTGDTLVKLSAPEGESFLGSVNSKGPAFKYVSSENLKDGYDFKITVDATSMSTVAQQAEKQKLLEYLSILTQFPMVAFSPYLVREIAYRVGYRNEKAIAEFQQMALLMELGRMQQLQGAVAPQQGQQGQIPNGNAPQQIAQQMTPPDGEQMRNQLQNQLGQTM